MLFKIKNIFKRKARKVDIISNLISKKYSILQGDAGDDSLLVDIGDPLVTLVTMEKNDTVVRIESTLIFESRVANLKTFSTMSHVAMTHGIAMSGLVPAKNQNLKVYLAIEMNYSEAKKTILDRLEEMRICLDTLVKYITVRSDHFEMRHIDLSMFDAIDLNGFDPQYLGEKKEFVFQSWKAFAQAIHDAAGEEYEITGSLVEVNACAEFEHKNKMLLSEVGDIILNELLWNREFLMAAEEDKYHVH